MKTKASSTWRTYPIIRSVTMAVTCLWCMALPPNAAAQSSGVLEEVVVTAQKREQSLQDVPISILAFTRDDLTTFKLENSNDLMNVTPGLYMNGPYAHSNPKIVMRGLGTDDFTEHVNPTVGYYVDEVFLGSPVGMTIGLLDLERIEVLKGPQGTLYGRNTTAGAINFISRKPGDTFSANGKAGYGNFDAWEIEGAADLPLSENLKSRIAVKAYSRDGTTKNRKFEDTLNNEIYQQGRAQLLWTPTENLSALLILDAYFNQSDGLVTQQIAYLPIGVATADVLGYRDTDGDNFAGEYTRRGGDDTDAWSATIKLDWDLGWGEIKSVTGYRDIDLFKIHEPDATAASTFEVETFAEFEQLSQELRLHTEINERARLVAGAYYYTDKNDAEHFAFYLDLFGPTSSHWYPRQDTTSYAVFGNLEYDLTSRLSFFGGIRWTHEKRKYDYFAQEVTVDSNDRPVRSGAYFTYVPESHREASWEDVAGEAGIRYAFSDDIMIYGKYSRGFKSGGFDGLIFNPGELEPFDPEFVDAYEIGAKATLFGGRAQVNLAAYYYDVKDLQGSTEVPDPTNPTGSIVRIENAAKAEIKGIELDITAQPIDNMILSLGLSVLDTEITSFETLGRDLSGGDLYSAPPINYNARASYNYDLANGGTVTPSVQVTFTDDMFFDIDNEAASRYRPGSYYLTDARLQYDAPGGRYSIALWSKNLFDEEYWYYAHALFISGVDVAYLGQPRMFGAEIAFNFD